MLLLITQIIQLDFCRELLFVVPLVGRSARSAGRYPQLQGRHGPTVPKNKSDVKLETFEDFREGENLKSRQLHVSFILSVLARGESKPCRSSTLSRDLFTLTD